MSLSAAIVAAPAPPENVISPLAVSALSELKNPPADTPSKVSASNPLPAPSLFSCQIL